MRRLLKPPPHIYSAVGFDRAAAFRKDLAWLTRRRSDVTTRVILAHGLNLSVLEAEGGPRAGFRTIAELGRDLDDSAVFLGVVDDVAYFVIDLDDPATAGLPLVDLRTVGPVLPAHEAGLLASARALLHWHATHRFCGSCGTETLPTEAGHARHCPNCGRDHFPRTDPAVIVLVTHGDQALLGRSPRFPPGMYSTLAGFVEPGESLEQAVEREILEESGVHLTTIQYRSSQPWPFPQSLMLGFRATAASTEMQIDQDELEDALWVPRDILADDERSPVKLPREDSIARFLIEEWLDEG
ncbi:MAG TPA: NAD(+) diphosphatase [Geminicoccus sp.]|uniref:NAD(+) diphosphatase n=1 Tax=Geminicoccus sp. TaxID=2024832 RepID=UPI002E32D95F|nr:NAD(+) diphosphatase [Geminicoccus sp.]HEX2525076.1 NAD(+) diphosphatase [Geminicoccus sp.]